MFYSFYAEIFSNPSITEYGGRGGGAGYTSTKLGVGVNPGDVIAVTVGAGQINNSSFFNQNDVVAPSSSVGDICSAEGGKRGYDISGTGYDTRGGDGGSGGGIGSRSGSFSYDAFSGGSDGGNGGGVERPGGKGQGTTTRYFGESTGTLYAGGGGGGGYGAGGAGGGGRGASALGGNGGSGSPNTGGGGGGGIGDYDDNIMTAGGTGGSGICIIRWDDQKS